MHYKEVEAIPAGRLVACRVVKPFRPGGDAELYVGDVVHLNPARAWQAYQEQDVRIERDKKGAPITVVDPAFLPPLPPTTAKVRLRIAGRYTPIGETEIRHCEVGEVIEIKETQAKVACSGENPPAVRV